MVPMSLCITAVMLSSSTSWSTQLFGTVLSGRTRMGLGGNPTRFGNLLLTEILSRSRLSGVFLAVAVLKEAEEVEIGFHVLYCAN